jgi:hypothetical protein
VDSLNGKTFTGKISRFTHEVDDNTRTMITEIEVPNPIWNWCRACMPRWF